MQKKLNLLSLVHAHQNLTENGFDQFISYHNFVLRNGEIDDLTKLILLLIDQNEINASNLENFLIGYRIPQIGKEFDLLRFGKNYHINIELKSVSNQEKILTQLKRNKYYMKFLGLPVYHLTFEADTNTLYYLNNDNTLKVINIHVLREWIKYQEIRKVVNADKLFNPSDYLVSPFNSTEKFIQNEYFLTHQQEEIKVKILDSICKSESPNFISLIGGAGTGKTLLAYDIVKKILEKEYKTIIFHCGQLNDGQKKLIKECWKIASIRNLKQYNLANFDLVLVDEAQRLRSDQLEKIDNEISTNNGKCIFAYDKLQTLNSNEERINSSGKITILCKGHIHTLSEKIRTNKEIANFITALLDKKRNFNEFKTDNIQIRYFNRLEDAKYFLSSLDKSEWEVLRFTPSQYSKEFHASYSQIGQVSHAVIGQEFEGIALIVDQFFTYNDDGNLIYNNNSYYLASKMLFQNLTRARKRLLIIILKNEELLTRCLSIT